MNVCYTMKDLIIDFVDDGVLRVYIVIHLPIQMLLITLLKRKKKRLLQIYSKVTTLQNEETKFKLYGHRIPILTHQ